MSRKIDFTNTNGAVFSTDGVKYLLLNIDGLGSPAGRVQSQKAPYQDGSTYIDLLYDDRTITCEVAILAPNDFDTISLRRREAVSKLNPKLGQGTLVYTDEAGNEWKITAIPVSSPAIPNKDYRDPYLRFQVTFLCNDPYFLLNEDADSIDLPTTENSDETVINSAASFFPSVIQLSDGSLFIAYKRGSDGYLISRTSSDGTTWSSENIINSANSSTPSVIQLSDGSLFIAYKRESDGYLVSRTSSDGTTWSSENIINSAIIFFPSVIQLSDGSLFIAYRRQSDVYLVSRTSSDGTTWSSENIINSANSSTPSVIQKSDGSLFIAYKRDTAPYLVSRTSSDGTTWSSENTINSSDSAAPSVIQKSDGSLFIAYINSSFFLVSRISINGIIWSNEDVINSVAYSYLPFVSVIQKSDRSLFITYRRNTTSYLVSVTRSVNPIKVVNLGDVPCPLQVTFNGPATNPRIIKQDTLEYIRLNTTLSASDYFTVNTAFGNKTVDLVQGGITKNGTAFLDVGSTFFQLDAAVLPDDLPIGVDVWNGQKLWLPLPDVFPEYPDLASGTTYINANFTAADGWIATNCTLSYSGGVMIMTATGANPKISRAVTASKTYRVKIKRVSGAGVASRIVNTTGTIYTNDKTYTSSDYQIQDFYIGAGATGNVEIYGATTGSATSDVYHISFIYIGTGEYATKLIDKTGNGNDATVYGATPVEGGFSFDGVNDYLKCGTSALIYNGITAVSFSVKLYKKSATQDIYTGLFTGDNRMYLRVQADNSVQSISGVNAVVSTFLTSAQYSDGDIKHFVLIWNRLTNLFYGWMDGELVVNGQSFTKATGTVSANNFGSLSGSSNFAQMELYHPRIYNRALSAAEIQYLSENPDIDYPVGSNTIYFEDDSVSSTATAEMTWQGRYSGV